MSTAPRSALRLFALLVLAAISVELWNRCSGVHKAIEAELTSWLPATSAETVSTPTHRIAVCKMPV